MDPSVFDNNEDSQEVEENMVQPNSVNNENTRREGKGENLENEVGTHPSGASVENISCREFIETSPRTAALRNDPGKMEKSQSSG